MAAAQLLLIGLIIWFGLGESSLHGFPKGLVCLHHNIILQFGLNHDYKQRNLNIGIVEQLFKEISGMDPT